MARSDVSVLYDASEVKDFEELAEINEQIKALEARKQGVVTKVKAHLQGKGITSAELHGATFSLVAAKRRTITRGEKDNFIAELVNQGKKHLVTYSIEPDLDGIFAEVDAGTLASDFVDKYVKVTEVVSLRCG